MVARSGHREVVVVVSAMGRATDELAGTAAQIGADDRDYAEIVSMGERTSARAFCSALRSLGVRAVYLDPLQREWPIVTDSDFRNAKPDVGATRRLVRRYLEPLLGEVVPVVCGFLGRDREGNVTTLGRGGSDITALLLANCLGADEAILVKETEGVLSADPRIVPDARPFERLDIHEMFALAQGGARIIRPEALRYKLPGQRLRVVRFSSGDLAGGGTEITGVFHANSAEVSRRGGLSAVTVVCEVSPENLGSLFSALSGKAVHGVCTGRNSITVFSRLGDVKGTVARLHGLGCFKAVSHVDGVGMVEVTHPAFIDSPGWVARIAETLASRGINILEITTSKATINVFIDEERLKDAFNAVGDAVEA